MKAEHAAALVNGLLVLFGPFALLALGSLLASDSYTSATVRESWRMEVVVIAAQMAGALLPFAALAAWRTWVHAKRWREQGRSGWPGVLEAGACGFATALLYLSPGIVTRPAEAPPYVIVYGGAALILGLLVGVLLRTTGVLVLKLHA